jgi:hypothetical protein
MRRALRLSLIVVLSLAGTASAQLVNENLLVEVPPEYKIDFKEHKANSLMNEMVPTGETVGNWTEMVTVQIFYNLKTTPEQFEGKMASGWMKYLRSVAVCDSRLPDRACPQAKN